MSIEEKIAALRDKETASAAIRAGNLFDILQDMCASPIERLFMAAWSGPHSLFYWFHGQPQPDHLSMMPDRTCCYAQAKIWRYTVDFLFVRQDGKQFVVECDGHDFHERTKAQARHDRSRDRWMVEQGITVLRFTGSEIYADAVACADQAFGVICS